MCLCLTNPKLCSLEQAVVLNLCKITEPRKRKLKIKILHDLKNFLKDFLKTLIVFYNSLGRNLFHFQNSLLQNNLTLKCQILIKKLFYL